MEFEMTLHRPLSATSAVTAFGLAGLCAVFAFASTATALPAPALVIDSEPILMVDGGDAGSSVDIMVFDLGMDFNFGYFDGAFQEILSAPSVMATTSFADGTAVDFAIQSAADSSMIYKLSDTNATLVFSGSSADYWESVTITWNVGNNNMIMSLASGDGFAPSDPVVSAVPEPTAAMTFLAGLAVAGWRVRRQPDA